jgi:hypothetical protein
MLDLLRVSGPLAWLVPFVRTGLAPRLGAHLQFRGDGKRGGIQVYFGRTSPLEISRGATGVIGFRAHAQYERLSPSLFRAQLVADHLGEIAGDLKAHLETASKSVNPTLVEGEAVPQAGMLRRYGLDCRSGDPFTAVDSEVRVAFNSQVERDAFERQQRTDLVIGDREEIPKKLDVLGLLLDGNVGVIELKAEGEDMRRAAIQAAAHVYVFRAMLAQRGPGYVAAVVDGMLKQKAEVGLLGSAKPPPLQATPSFVPVIAAPDAGPGWRDAWLRELAPVQTSVGDRLDALRLWRVSDHGEILEDVAP